MTNLMCSLPASLVFKDMHDQIVYDKKKQQKKETKKMRKITHKLVAINLFEVGIFLLLLG